MNSHIRNLVRLVPVGVAILFVLAGSRTASAQIACFTNLLNCYERAAARDSFLERTAAALDCELDFADCSRRAILGR